VTSPTVNDFEKNAALQAQAFYNTQVDNQMLESLCLATKITRSKTPSKDCATLHNFNNNNSMNLLTKKLSFTCIV